MRKETIAIISIALALAIALPVLGYLYQTEPKHTPSGVVVVQSSAAFGLYWDSICTSPVTYIDFGQAGRGARIIKLIYVKNLGNVNIQIYWNSSLQDLYFAPNPWRDIWDSWNHTPEGTTINTTTIGPGQIIDTYYGIKVENTAPLGTYNWTLTTWATY